MKIAALLVVAASLAILPGLAHAQHRTPSGKGDPTLAEAKRLFDEGAEDYAKGEYDKAIEAWLTSYDLSKRPLIYESIANAYERLGKPKDAREYLAKWREAAPKDEWELLDERLKNLDARIAQDQRDADKKAADEKALAAKSQAQPPPPPPPQASRSPLPYILLAGGGALVVGGVVVDLIAKGKRPDTSGVCRTSPSGDTLCLDSSKSAISSSNTLAVAGDVVWIAGGLAATTGLVLLLLRKPPQPSDARAARIVPVISPSFGGLALHATF